MKNLEVFFGTELLHQGHGRFELTPIGRELFEIVQSHCTAMEDLANRCAEQNVELSIGAGESLLEWLVQPGLADFRRIHPTTTLMLHNLRTKEITMRLGDGRIDLGLLRQDLVHPPLKSARLGSIECGLVIPGGDTQPTTGKQLFSRLAMVPVALLAGSEVASAFEAEAKKSGARLKVCIRASSYTQLVDAVHQIPCAAVLLMFAAAAFESVGQVVSLTVLKSFTRPMVLAWNPRSVALRPRVSSGIEVLHQILSRRPGSFE